MAADDLQQLERDVEAARSKLTSDIAALRSPNAFSEFTQNLKQAALETRDNFIDDARSRTRSAIEEMVESVKEKAIANPAAALVIGAGLAWHLIRRPPVAAALIGGGLFSLLRTDPGVRRPNGHADPMERARENLKEQVGEFAATAGELGRQAADVAKEKVSELAEAAGEKASVLREAASDRMGELSATAKEKVADLTEKAKGAVANAPLIGSRSDAAAEPQSYYGLPGEQPVDMYANGQSSRGLSTISTDKLLLGAAGIAVAAAIAAMYQRRHDDDTD